MDVLSTQDKVQDSRDPEVPAYDFNYPTATIKGKMKSHIFKSEQPLPDVIEMTIDPSTLKLVDKEKQSYTATVELLYPDQFRARLSELPLMYVAGQKVVKLEKSTLASKTKTSGFQSGDPAILSLSA